MCSRRFTGIALLGLLAPAAATLRGLGAQEAAALRKAEQPGATALMFAKAEEIAEMGKMEEIGEASNIAKMKEGLNMSVLDTIPQEIPDLDSLNNLRPDSTMNLRPDTAGELHPTTLDDLASPKEDLRKLKVNPWDEYYKQKKVDAGMQVNRPRDEVKMQEAWRNAKDKEDPNEYEELNHSGLEDSHYDPTKSPQLDLESNQHFDPNESPEQSQYSKSLDDSPSGSGFDNSFFDSLKDNDESLNQDEFEHEDHESLHDSVDSSRKSQIEHEDAGLNDVINEHEDPVERDQDHQKALVDQWTRDNKAKAEKEKARKKKKATIIGGVVIGGIVTGGVTTKVLVDKSHQNDKSDKDQKKD